MSVRNSSHVKLRVRRDDTGKFFIHGAIFDTCCGLDRDHTHHRVDEHIAEGDRISINTGRIVYYRANTVTGEMTWYVCDSQTDELLYKAL